MYYVLPQRTGAVLMSTMFLSSCGHKVTELTRLLELVVYF